MNEYIVSELVSTLCEVAWVSQSTKSYHSRLHCLRSHKHHMFKMVWVSINRAISWASLCVVWLLFELELVTMVMINDLGGYFRCLVAMVMIWFDLICTFVKITIDMDCVIIFNWVHIIGGSTLGGVGQQYSPQDFLFYFNIFYNFYCCPHKN